MICNKEVFTALKGQDMIDLECDSCKKTFQRTKKVCYQNIYKDGALRFESKCFCCKQCKTSFFQNRKICICKNCNEKFQSSASKPSKFCSHSCSAIYNNKIRGQVTCKQVKCDLCNCAIVIPNWVTRKKYKCVICMTQLKQKNATKAKNFQQKRKCKECGEMFIKTLYNSYCSNNCKKLSIRSYVLTCRHCCVSYRAERANSKFCSGSCRSKNLNLHTYAHNKSGLSRSKIELFVEQKLLENFSHLQIIFNDKQTIGSEIDIYIPSLKLGFELNGVYHYIPIHGKSILNNIQKRDEQKNKECVIRSIKLVTIDLGNCSFTKSYADDIYKNISQHIKDALISL